MPQSRLVGLTQASQTYCPLMMIVKASVEALATPIELHFATKQTAAMAS